MRSSVALAQEDTLREPMLKQLPTGNTQTFLVMSDSEAMSHHQELKERNATNTGQHERQPPISDRSQCEAMAQEQALLKNIENGATNKCTA